MVYRIPNESCLGPARASFRREHARMAASVLSHLDPDFIPLLHEVGSSLRRLFRADDKALALATSGTGGRRWKPPWPTSLPTACAAS